MVCIYCSGKTDVTNSRHQKRSNKVWRRRQCKTCGSLFTTLEAVVLSETLMMHSKAAKSQLAPFMRDKLFISIYSSCRHRDTAVADATALTDTVLSSLPTISNNGLVNRQELTQTVQTVLNRFDSVAGVHYAAFHKN